MMSEAVDHVTLQSLAVLGRHVCHVYLFMHSEFLIAVDDSTFVLLNTTSMRYNAECAESMKFSRSIDEVIVDVGNKILKWDRRNIAEGNGKSV